MDARPWLSYLEYFKINYIGEVDDDIDGDVDEGYTIITEVSWRSNFVVMVPMVRVLPSQNTPPNYVLLYYSSLFLVSYPLYSRLCPRLSIIQL